MSGASSCCDAGCDCCKTGYPALDKLWNPVSRTLSCIYSHICGNLVQIEVTQAWYLHALVVAWWVFLQVFVYEYLRLVGYLGLMYRDG